MTEMQPLTWFIERHYAFLPPHQQRRILSAFAGFVRGLHEAGRYMCQPGLEDFSIQMKAESWEFDFTGDFVSQKNPLSFTQRCEILASLVAVRYNTVSRGLVLRFLQCYLGGSLRSELLSAVRSAALKLAGRNWTDETALCLKTGSRFDVFRSGRFKVYRAATEEARELVTELLPDPDRALKAGERLPGRGNACVTVKIYHRGRYYVLKRYNCRGWRYQFRHVLRSARAVRAWTASWGFLARGIDIPKPVACLEERTLRLLGRSYILSEFATGASTLSRYWTEIDDADRKSLLVRCAILYGRLHRSGAIHGDSNWDNILVSNQGRNIQLIDMDCSRIYRVPRRKKNDRDIGHFFRDLGRFAPGNADSRRLFERIWRKWADN